MHRSLLCAVAAMVLSAGGCRDRGSVGSASGDAGQAQIADGGATERLAVERMDLLNDLRLSQLRHQGDLDKQLLGDPRLKGVDQQKLRAFVEKALDNTSRVVGDDDRKPYVPQDAPTLEPVARATGFVKGEACTATYLGDHLAVTAGHCRSIANYDELRDVPCDFEIEWRRTQLGASGTSRCARVLAAKFDWSSEDRGLDYMIVRLADDGGYLPPPLQRPWCKGAPPPGTRLAVLSYPAGRPLTNSGPCSVQQAPPGLRLKPGLIAHDCDTESGSSGAGLIEADSQCLVAIHDGGKQLPAPAGGGPVNINFATLLTATPLEYWLPKETPQ